ncbi:MAG: CoA transferase, partial [Tardiphaga sp.]
MAIERKLSPTHEAPYRGLRVLDFGQGIASPYCAMLLGVYGAEVIKVEPPTGDMVRASAPSRHQHFGALFLNLNRNKRAIVLDLKSPQAIDVMRKLIAGVDVLAHNMRPGALKRA